MYMRGCGARHPAEFTMRQLIWKEWHEQAWKLAFGCIVLGAFAFIGVRTRIIPDEQMLLWVCFPAIGLLPLLATIGLVPTERSDGTFNTLAALPVPMRSIVWLKIATGLVLCVVPLLLAMLISVAFFGGREMSISAIVALFMRSMLSSAALFVWMFAATIRLPTEPRAAMVSIGVLLIWLMISVGTAQAQRPLLSTLSPLSFSVNGLPAIYHNPQSVLSMTAFPWRYRGAPVPLLPINLLVQSVIVLSLWLWTTRSAAKAD